MNKETIREYIQNQQEIDKIEVGKEKAPYMIACLAFVASEAVTNTDIRKRLKYKRNEKMRLSENNAFSTSHQSVTVYGLPKKIYEARTEDTAVDVQIHRTTGQIAPVV